MEWYSMSKPAIPKLQAARLHLHDAHLLQAPLRSQFLLSATERHLRVGLVWHVGSISRQAEEIRCIHIRIWDSLLKHTAIF